MPAFREHEPHRLASFLLPANRQARPATACAYAGLPWPRRPARQKTRTRKCRTMRPARTGFFAVLVLFFEHRERENIVSLFEIREAAAVAAIKDCPRILSVVGWAAGVKMGIRDKGRAAVAHSVPEK